MKNLDATSWAKATVLGALLSVGCSSVTASSADSSGAGGNGDGGSGAGAGAGAASVASAGSGNATPSGGAGGDASGGDGGVGATTSAGGGGGAVDATGTQSKGAIIVSNLSGATAHYLVSGSFGPPDVAAGEVCTQGTTGACTTIVCTAPSGGRGAPLPATVSMGLNAGAITVTGVGPALATMTFGPLAPSSPIIEYAPVFGTGHFFKGGDKLTATGAGGPDLPAFAARTIVAPNDILLTAPGPCVATGMPPVPPAPPLPSTCPALNRTQDLAVAWTGGGAGTLTIAFVTSSTNAGTDRSASVICAFDASAGSGTVPHTVLALLDQTASGIETVSSNNELNFMVGDMPTTFQADAFVMSGVLTVSN
jgi:hypothetical protein